MHYDINYTYTESSVFKDGKRINAIMKVVTEPVSTLNKVLIPQKSMSVSASSVYFIPVTPKLCGFPATYPPNCYWTYNSIFTYDADGCIHDIAHYYVSHYCLGADDGDGSGSGSDEGNPPYAGDPPNPTVTPPSSQALRNQIKDKPYALLNIPCPIVMEWLSTVRHEVSQAQIDKLASLVDVTVIPIGQPPITLVGIGQVQHINDAHSSVVNMDYFPVTIQELPIINNQQVTAEQFLSYIRKNLNSFVDSDKAEFTPYQWNGVNDNSLWNSNNPLNSVIAIDIGDSPDNGSVIVSKATSDQWTFTTVREPFYGSHPVSGNRDFGYVENSDGSYTFYTRGVDRLTNMSTSILYGMSSTFGLHYPLSEADALWKSFQEKVTKFANDNAGLATSLPETTYRPDWATVQQVLLGNLPLSTLSKDCPD